MQYLDCSLMLKVSLIRVKKILSHRYTFHFIGLILLSITMTLIEIYYNDKNSSIINSNWIGILSYILITMIIPKITVFLYVDRKYYVFPIVSSIYILDILIITMLRLDYSRSILLSAYSFSLAWLYIDSIFRLKNKKLSLFFIDNFDISRIKKSTRINLHQAASPYDIDKIKDGLIVNLHHPLSSEQEKFISDCSIRGINVLHAPKLEEMLFGKVQTDTLSENALGSLLPDPLYKSIKKIWETLFILILLPIYIPIMLITAILIKLESNGPILYSQWRVGEGGKKFNIYKFRSMSCNNNDTCKYATTEYNRITKVGKFIRKYRIDELPQFYNVLKGDMALIGPRPEQEEFVKLYEKEIAFYGYRHIVKPGITGWAQTVQGYTDNTEKTKEKLSYDLYYIKHFSCWLDINIILKTLKTMLTGFGAK